MHNWYDVLDVREDVAERDLQNLRTMAQREHHADKFASRSLEVQEWHAARLSQILRGVDFLLNPQRRRELDDYLAGQKQRFRASGPASAQAPGAQEQRARRAEEPDGRGYDGQPVDLDPTGGFLADAAEAVEAALSGARVAVHAAYSSLSGANGWDAPTVRSTSSVQWTQPYLPLMWHGLHRGLLVGTDRAMLWTESATRKLGRGRREEVLKVRRLTYEELLAVEASGKDVLIVHVDSGPTLRFRVYEGTRVAQLAAYLDARTK
ncbi:MAG TPA: hypothetical protein VF533_20780 [Solirubrobacteraceae bacterium]